MNIAVFVSGNGSNLQALINAEKESKLSGGRIVLVVSDNAGVFALKRAEEASIKTCVVEYKGFSSREEYDRRVCNILESEGIELIVLAGFMRILSGWMVKRYDGRILNIHPSLLPAYKGGHAIKDAFDAGEKVAGVTVHFADKKLDAGPVILQREVPIDGSDTLETLEKKIHKVEHELYPEAVRLFVEGKLKIDGNIVKILR